MKKIMLMMLMLSISVVSCDSGDSDGGIKVLPGENFINAAGEADDELGCSVAISADGTIMVVGEKCGTGVNHDDQGAAYVYMKADGTWSRVARLTVSDGADRDYFGSNVAISGDGSTIVVGAWLKDLNSKSASGAVYVFVKPGGGWEDATETACLSVEGTPSIYELGVSVAVSSDGGMILSGMRANNSAYVFEKPGAVWTSSTTEKYKLEPEDGDLGNFGSSVAMTATTYVVGSPDSDITYNGQGAFYIFD